ncbi:hypothetical protein INT47_007046 [Mucor saturninus]|uniref:Uncharacterized protein n=1 Tax=Mucor saturninus TaxID=64648 RepID=A0A8H7V3F2_9FUNG|nr:hypothetical protein INT47_007046 [Mucor saturninus]
MLSTHANRKLRPRLQVVPTKYSQSTPTHLYSPQQMDFMEDPPYSPAASTTSIISSVSWVAEKSASELGTLLKNAYKSLREKEKNLLLAAEIGKSLLEHNQNLKRDYDKLIQNVSECKARGDENDKIRSSRKAYDAIIESLEQKNAEIQSMLDQTQQHSQLTQQQYELKQRKLESEITKLTADLDIAASKIHELEELSVQKRQIRKHMDEMRDFELQQKSDDLVLMEELTTKMQELFTENKQLQASKKSVEEKLIVSLHDLEKLRCNFEHFELTQQGYSTLQEAFERQTTHIQELNDSLEDHRQILSRLRDKGLLHSNTASLYNDDGDDSRPTMTGSSMQSLMGELENAFSSRKHTNGLTKSSSDSNLSTFTKIYDLASMTEHKLTSFYKRPGDCILETLLSTVGVNDRRIMEEAENLLESASDELFAPEQDGNDMYAELNLYPNILPTISSQLLKLDDDDCIQPKGLSNRILFQIRYLFRSIFRWCRFAIILVTAVLINLWKGPDLILEK